MIDLLGATGAATARCIARTAKVAAQVFCEWLNRTRIAFEQADRQTRYHDPFNPADCSGNEPADTENNRERNAPGFEYAQYSMISSM